MRDEMPSGVKVGLGIAAVVLFAVLGSLAVGSRAVDDCRAEVSRATTSYKAEKALRSAACMEARGR